MLLWAQTLLLGVVAAQGAKLLHNTFCGVVATQDPTTPQNKVCTFTLALVPKLKSPAVTPAL